MLQILWKESDAKGYTDIIPLEWIETSGKHQSKQHEVLSPDNQIAWAKCSVMSSENRLILDYGGKHAAFNKKTGNEIGQIMIVFSDKGRRHIDHVSWKPEGEQRFTPSKVETTFTADIGKPKREAIEKAIKECDRVGRQRFLKKYGFLGARDYFLVHEEKNYDSKAIVAVSYKFTPLRRALRPSELYGGVNGAAKLLRDLGFQILTPGENADWSWEEHVLALHLYMQHRTNPPKKDGHLISNLSLLLNRLGEKTGARKTAKFRNNNGVYMKLMNFRRFDPQFRTAGKSGLSRGSSLEGEVWRKYFNDPKSLNEEAEAIRLAINDERVSLLDLDTEEEGSKEGKVIIRLHRLRERDARLAQQKKQFEFKKTGRLRCEVCEFDFFKIYGDHGLGYMEAHHREPLASLKAASETTLSKLALVCANCHRMLHRNGLFSVEELKDKLRAVKLSLS